MLTFLNCFVHAQQGLCKLLAPGMSLKQCIFCVAILQLKTVCVKRWVLGQPVDNFFSITAMPRDSRHSGVAAQIHNTTYGVSY
jgi:hypothetical protein